MRVADDAGTVLNAAFSVEPDGGHLAVVLESAGGRTPGGGTLLTEDQAVSVAQGDVLAAVLGTVASVTVDGERVVLRDGRWTCTSGCSRAG